VTSVSPCPSSSTTTTADGVVAFAQRHGWPVVVKLASGGYDGRGVWMVDDAGGLAAVPIDGRELVVEPRLALERESRGAGQRAGRAVTSSSIRSVETGAA
jgi:5-(carboxyamino)imidazole ribonucleotide synthase